jgi:erythromycin esterase-like protein
MFRPCPNRFIVIFVSLIVGVVASERVVAASDAIETDRLVRNVCAKDVVMLGEDAHHASGATVEVKASIVQALIDRCGFDTVAFESGFYDFVDFGRAIRRGDATRVRLADAIGGLWSTSAEMQPLIDSLFAKAKTGAIRVVGIDPQTGGATSHYAQQRMPVELAAVLAGAQRETCRVEIDRLTNWRYDDATTFYDDATRARLAACAHDIEQAASRTGDATAAEDARMARELGLSLDLSGLDAFPRRDAAMSANVEWFRSSEKRGGRIIVWCATVHAATSALPSHPRWKPLGAHLRQALGDRVAAIGFTAVAGSYGRPGELQTPLADPPLDAIEHDIGASLEGAKYRYVDRAMLAKRARSPARAFDYARFDTIEWVAALDGLIVLREEHPMHAVLRH